MFLPPRAKGPTVRDIERLLEQAATEELGPPPLEDIVARSRRKRVVARAVIAGGVAATVAVVAAIVAVVLPGTDPAPVIDEPAPSEEADTGGGADDSSDTGTDDDTDAPGHATISIAELDADVFVARGDEAGQVEVFSPDGDQRTLPLEPPPASAPRLVPDGMGGFAWQPSDEGEGSSIRHVDGSGVASVLVSASDPQERLALVGRADRALVTRVEGSTPDDTSGELLSVPFDGGEPVTVRDDVVGWEDDIELAAGHEILLYARSAGASSSAVVDPPASEPVTVFEGGEADGEYVRGVGATGPDIGVVLVERAAGFPDHPEARLLLVDLSDAAIIEEVEVPLQLGAEDSWHVARDVSTHDDFVLINRDAEGTWLAPLVYDLGTGAWSVLEGVEGRAALARPVGPEPATATCAEEEDELRNAPPIEGQAHLYLPCDGAVGDSLVPVFRVEADTELTGDTQQDAAALLDELLDAPSAQQRDRGYWSPVEGADISVRSVAVDGGLLIVDLRFPDGGVNNLNATAASAYWHATLTGTLFQLPGIDRIELRLDGSCEDYTRFFQGAGCQRHDRDDAPWASS